MNLRRIRSKLLAGHLILEGKVQESYSQAGEDMIVRYLLNDCLQISNPSYLDIGCFHPIRGNNTYYFYSRGAKGVCVEPNPYYAKLIKKWRKRDVFLHGGIGVDNKKSSDYYSFPDKYAGWNTFSLEEANSRSEQTGIPFEVEKDLTLLNINQVIEAHFAPWPTLISIDVEGLDMAILQTLDFSRFQSEIFCVESISFSHTNEQTKLNDIPSFMESMGYFVFADTYVNTIFCKSSAFKKISR